MVKSMQKIFYSIVLNLAIRQGNCIRLQKALLSTGGVNNIFSYLFLIIVLTVSSKYKRLMVFSKCDLYQPLLFVEVLT